MEPFVIVIDAGRGSRHPMLGVGVDVVSVDDTVKNKCDGDGVCMRIVAQAVTCDCCRQQGFYAIAYAEWVPCEKVPIRIAELCIVGRIFISFHFKAGGSSPLPSCQQRWTPFVVILAGSSPKLM